MAAVLGRPEARATDSRYTSNAFLFSFEGRINRAKYWYAIVASSVACMVFLSIVAYAIGGIVMIALSLWGFVEVLCLRGTRGTDLAKTRRRRSIAARVQRRIGTS